MCIVYCALCILYPSPAHEVTLGTEQPDTLHGLTRPPAPLMILHLASLAARLTDAAVADAAVADAAVAVVAAAVVAAVVAAARGLRLVQASHLND